MYVYMYTHVFIYLFIDGYVDMRTDWQADGLDRWTDASRARPRLPASAAVRSKSLPSQGPPPFPACPPREAAPPISSRSVEKYMCIYNVHASLSLSIYIYIYAYDKALRVSAWQMGVAWSL